MRSKLKLVPKLRFLKKENIQESDTPAIIDEVISDDVDIADTFNKFFLNMVPNLKTSPKETFTTIMQMKLTNQPLKAHSQVLDCF